MLQDIEINDQLEERIENADAIVASHQLILSLAENFEGNPRYFACGNVSMGYELIEDGEIVTQVGMGAPEQYDNLVSVWVNDNDRLTSVESESNESEPDSTDSDTQTPADSTTSKSSPETDGRNYETLQAVLTVIDNHDDSLPEQQSNDLDEYKRGRHDALSDVRIKLEGWLD